MSIYTLPGTTTVTDVDPGGVVWVTGNVVAEPIDEFDALTAEPGRTHATTGMLGIDSGHDDRRRFRAHSTRSDARAMLDPTCPADAEDWRVFALVPAQVADGDVRPEGEPWSDLLCALALTAGRPGSRDGAPLGFAAGALVLWADPADYDDTELAQLAAWGWVPDDHEPAFLSYRHTGAL